MKDFIMTSDVRIENVQFFPTRNVKSSISVSLAKRLLWIYSKAQLRYRLFYETLQTGP